MMIILTCLLGIFVKPLFGFHIYIDDNTERCFVENVGERVLITANYEYLNVQEKIGCTLLIRSPNDKIISKIDMLSKPKGKLSYISENSGVHRICIYCSLSNWMETEKPKLFLSVETADVLDKFGNQRHYDFDNLNPAKKHEIETLINEIQKFTHSVSSIKDEQLLDEFVTNKFYNLFNKVHEYILYFYLAQIIALCVCVTYSIRHLNKYFKSQRLI